MITFTMDGFIYGANSDEVVITYTRLD